MLTLCFTIFSFIVLSPCVHFILDLSLLFSVVRLELENRLAALEQQRALKDAANRAQKEEWEERLRSAQQGEESGRIEVQTLRSVFKQLHYPSIHLLLLIRDCSRHPFPPANLSSSPWGIPRTDFSRASATACLVKLI